MKVCGVLYLAHENLLRVFLLMCEFEEFVDKCLLFRYYLYLCIAAG
ncbi:unknown [Prevotella sp. CAG:592]|nr:unknown [Prevotella sp. CAG:592]